MTESNVSTERLAEIVARYHDAAEPFAEEIGMIAAELLALRTPSDGEVVAWQVRHVDQLDGWDTFGRLPDWHKELRQDGSPMWVVRPLYATHGKE